MPISEIREPFHLMRFVDRDSVDFWELKDSIREHGFFNSVAVRPSEKHPGFYEVVDGLHRYTAAKELGLETLPCIIKEGVDNDELLIAQLQANAIRPPTTRVEYARQLRRIMARNPEMTLIQLSGRIGKSPAWIRDTMGLLTLPPEIQDIVDRGEICASNAVWLAKLPKSLHTEFVPKAKQMKSDNFRREAGDALRISKAQYVTERVGRRFNKNLRSTLEPTAYLRSLDEIICEITVRTAGASVIAREVCQTPLDGFYAGLNWCAHCDEASRERMHHKMVEMQRRYFGREEEA